MSIISWGGVGLYHTALFQQTQSVLDCTLLRGHLADGLAIRLDLMRQLRYGGYYPVEQLGVGRL